MSTTERLTEVSPWVWLDMFPQDGNMITEEHNVRHPHHLCSKGKFRMESIALPGGANSPPRVWKERESWMGCLVEHVRVLDAWILIGLPLSMDDEARKQNA